MIIGWWKFLSLFCHVKLGALTHRFILRVEYESDTKTHPAVAHQTGAAHVQSFLTSDISELNFWPNALRGQRDLCWAKAVDKCSTVNSPDILTLRSIWGSMKRLTLSSLAVWSSREPISSSKAAENRKFTNRTTLSQQCSRISECLLSWKIRN